MVVTMTLTMILALATLLHTSMAMATDVERRPARDQSFTPRTVTKTVTRIQSGDEIHLGQLKVRLAGIVTPRFGTALGTKAVFHLNVLIRNKDITCRLSGRGYREAELGECHLRGKDIARSLIREGLALPCPKLGGRQYRRDWEKAKDTGIKTAFAPPRYCGGID